MSSQVSALRLFDLIQSQRVTAVIYVAARLGLAELLSYGPQTVGKLAKATGADERSLGRLLTALSTIGICSRTGEDRYALTDMGACLDSSGKHSVKGWAILEAELISKSWSGMLESIMTGKTAAQLQGVDDSFELMGRTPEIVDKFNVAMVELTRLVTPNVLQSYDFSGISHLMDVGGGSGELLGAIAQQNRKLRGTVFDLPRCAEAAGKHLQQIGVSDRVEFVAGDFFKSIPAVADAVILKSIIHDWNDDRSISILRNCRQALPSNGKLLLVERLMPEKPTATDEDKAHAMSDLNMMRGPGGCERTERQYRELLEQSGFALVKVNPAGRFNLIEARPA
ncbi:methyltransferase domain-containing protein [Bradyrhizobium sp. WSM 1738]|uniref:acetylserotonin O-methyltransferase n=1 Tax=Bradyrhizobium hereditatis TaxID=2821405 RepID=UPI001CE38C9B|nr:acetylserotonin O-methyltransferase [Bradyrhizobium hereditatis]MCA6118478.1 methyltransferase domain-containing protein [Bradyrhizobium hereditatis]